jgi:hypothetical protein
MHLGDVQMAVSGLLRQPPCLPWFSLLPFAPLLVGTVLTGVDPVSLDGGVVPAGSLVGLPQSLCAAAETVSPWPGPGGVFWATPDTNSPWFVTPAGHGIEVGLVDAAVVLVELGGAVDDDVDG